MCDVSVCQVDSSRLVGSRGNDKSASSWQVPSASKTMPHAAHLSVASPANNIEAVITNVVRLNRHGSEHNVSVYTCMEVCHGWCRI